MRLCRVSKPELIQEYGEYMVAESRRLTQLINNLGNQSWSERDRGTVAASDGEWKFEVVGPWAYVTPAGARSPEQGWKLHISATEASKDGEENWSTRAPGPTGSPTDMAEARSPAPRCVTTTTPAAPASPSSILKTGFSGRSI